MTNLRDVEQAIYQAEKHFGQSIRVCCIWPVLVMCLSIFSRRTSIHWLIRQKRISQKKCQGKQTGHGSCRKPLSMIRQYRLSFDRSMAFWRYNIWGILCGQQLLDGLAHALTFQEGRRAISLNFSMWDNLGLSKGIPEQLSPFARDFN